MIFRHSKIVALIALCILLFFFEGGGIAARWYIAGFDMVFPNRLIHDDEKTILLEMRISELEKELNASASTSMVSARVVLGGGSLFSDTLVIDRGAVAGVRENDLAVERRIYVVGTVQTVFDDYAVVAPFSRLGARTTLRAGFFKEIVFEVEGSGGGEMHAMLPLAVPLVVGDPVWLGGASQYSVGLIADVDKKEGRDFQEVTIAHPFLLRSIVDLELEHVYAE